MKLSTPRSAAACLRVLALVGAAALLLASCDSAPSSDEADADNVLRAQLDNGLRVVVVPNRLAPVATSVVTYRVGANETPEGFPGRAHALEHMMFRGSPGLSAEQLSAISSATGASFNAVTRQSVTQYYFTAPAQFLGVILHMQALRMSGIMNAPALWQKERGAILQEVASNLSNPEYKFFTQLIERMFAGTPYAIDGLGTVEGLKNTTAAELQAFYDEWYVPNNATLVVVGDVDPQRVLERVRALFGDIPSHPLPKRPKVDLQALEPEQLSTETAAPYGLAVISFRLPGYMDEDYAAAAVLADVLDSRRGDLYALVARGKALAANFALNAYPQAGMGYVIGAFPRGGDGEALLQRMREVIRERVRKGISPALVEAAKRSAVTRAEAEQNSISGLAMSWAYALTVQGLDSPDAVVDAIQRVTVADVNRVARRYLNLDTAITGLLRPTRTGEAVAGGASGSAEHDFELTNLGDVKLPDWAAAKLQQLSMPDIKIDPVVTTLDNGLKVIVQPAYTSDTVSVYGQIRNEPALTMPKDEEGVDEVLDQLFAYGTEQLDRLALQRELDEIGAQESAGQDFTLVVLSEHFERGVELLAQHELHPALPAKAFKTVRSQVAAAVAGRLQSPDYRFRRALLKALYPKGDPTLRQATPETVSSLELADVEAYYGRIFRPDLTSVVVIGNIEPQRALDTIRRYFADWQAEGAQPDTTLPPVPPSGTTHISVVDPTRVQDRVVLAQTLAVTRKGPGYYALQLGNQVLSGGFYASRLYRALRSERGLVYYVHSDVDATKTRADFSIAFASDPENVDIASAIIRQNLSQMQHEPVAGEELFRAKAQLVRAIPLAQSSQQGIAEGLLYRAAHDLPLDEPLDAAHAYLKMDGREVMEAFRQWVRPRELARVSQGPPQ
ncbi:MAG: insulinase family protein [Nitrococcus sp.]|nr:insulinase family protein [Nitrococcus sp.]